MWPMSGSAIEPPFISLADDLDAAMDLLRCPCGRHRLTKDRVRAVAAELRRIAHEQ
jgi:DNA-directed RNA polymerase subunit RPC12/RpoP